MGNFESKKGESLEEKRDIIEEIVLKLDDIQDVKYDKASDHILVHPRKDKGFSVELNVNSEEYILTHTCPK